MQPVATGRSTKYSSEVNEEAGQTSTARSILLPPNPPIAPNPPQLPKQSVMPDRAIVGQAGLLGYRALQWVNTVGVAPRVWDLLLMVACGTILFVFNMGAILVFVVGEGYWLLCLLPLCPLSIWGLHYWSYHFRHKIECEPIASPLEMEGTGPTAAASAGALRVLSMPAAEFVWAKATPNQPPALPGRPIIPSVGRAEPMRVLPMDEQA